MSWLVWVDHVLWCLDFADVWHVVAWLFHGVVVVFVSVLLTVLEVGQEGLVEDMLNEVGVVVVSDVPVSGAVVVVPVVVVGVWVRVIVSLWVEVGAVGVSVSPVTVFPAVGVGFAVDGGSLVLWVIADFTVPWVGIVVSVIWVVAVGVVFVGMLVAVWVHVVVFSLAVLTLVVDWLVVVVFVEPG